MKYIELIVFGVILFSCVHPSKDDFIQQDSFETIPIEYGLNREPRMKLSEFVKDIKFIPLELTDECLLRGVERAEITDEYIFDYRNVPEELSKDNITAAMKTFFPTYSNEQFGKEFLYNKNLYPVYRIKLIINNEKSFIVEITRTSAIYKYYVEEFNNIISVRQEIYPG